MPIPYNQQDAGQTWTTQTSRKHYISDDYSIGEVITIIESGAVLRQATYELLYDYYKGNHRGIQQRFFDDLNKPNNKIVNNFPKLIVDTTTSYLVGEEVSYRGNQKAIDAIMPILQANNVNDVNFEEVKLGGIMGHAMEIHWLDGESQHRFKQVPASQCFIAYSMDIEEIPLVGVHYNTYRGADNVTRRNVTVYTENEVIKFVYEVPTQGHEGSIPYNEKSRTEHFWGELPVIEVVANDERIGDFEAQISQVEAYNMAQSDSLNDVNYMNDSYLWLKGFTATEPEDIQAMKNNRVMITEADPEGDTDIKWLTKEVNDTHIENIKKRLKEDIFSFSQTPDLSGDNFSASSGVAIKYRTQTLENKAKVKETKLNAAMKKRFRLIGKTLALKGKVVDYDDVYPIFVRNLPASLSELADMIVKLKGTVSDETLIAQLGFIPDPVEEVERATKQLEKQMVAQAGGVSIAKENKLDNNQTGNTSSTLSAVALKAQETARNKEPLNQPKAK